MSSRHRSLIVMAGIVVPAMLFTAYRSGYCLNTPDVTSADSLLVSSDSIDVADSIDVRTLPESLPVDTAFVHYTDTIAVNGTTLIYEVKGRGKPVILLHGNGGSHHDLDSSMNVLSRSGYRVYGIDSRGQGANPPVSEYHYADMAEDVYQFILQHGLPRPVIYGWSDGGNIALQLEVTHPGTCAAIITSGANIFPEGWGGKKNIEDRKARDPHPQPLRRMLYYEPTMTFHDMTTIQCPALICAGQHDVILPVHTRTIADSIPRGTLHIERGANHTNYVKHSSRIAHIVLDYLQTIGY